MELKVSLLNSPWGIIAKGIKAIEVGESRIKRVCLAVLKVLCITSLLVSS
jgi:hypothetical protein